MADVRRLHERGHRVGGRRAGEGRRNAQESPGHERCDHARVTDAATRAAREELLAKAMTLTYADERVDEERMSPLDHEALWWRVYEQLAPARAATSDRKMPH